MWEVGWTTKTRIDVIIKGATFSPLHQDTVKRLNKDMRVNVRNGYTVKWESWDQRLRIGHFRAMHGGT